jgi:outer membrane protein OmpA-like peptidoglycan-associated protein
MGGPAMSDSGDTAYAAPTGLLQEQAFQQQAMAAQRMQQIASERRAFDEQARQHAIEQQWQREQLIQQQQAQWRFPAGYQQAAAPAPQAAAVYPPQQAYQAPAVAGQLVGLIYFGHGSARLDARDRQVLQQVVALQQSQGRGLRVVGHASARTDAADMARHEEKNRTMSIQRAEAVASALVSMGADGGHINIDGAGDAQPVFHEFTSTGEAGNRRVEIFLE